MTAVALSSCGLFYRVAFQIKKPRFESYHSINTYSHTLGIDSSAVAFSKDTAGNAALTRYFGGYQDILIFDRERRFIAYKNDSLSCNASVDTVFKRICTIGNNPIPTKRHVPFDTFTGLLDNHNHALDDINDPSYDYIVFADFAKFFPQVNRNHLPYWDKAIKTHHGSCKTKIVYIDLDYMDTWNLPASALPSLHLSANK